MQKTLMGKEVIVFDTEEATFCEGIVVEHSTVFLGIRKNSFSRRQYPVRDIESGEFVVYVKEDF